LDSRTKELDIQQKIKEAEIKKSGLKSKEEKQQAQDLIDLYKQELGLSQLRSGIVEQQGRSAIGIALDNQKSIGEEGVTKLKELEIKARQLGITQGLDREKLDAQFQGSSSAQRIAGAKPFDGSKSAPVQVVGQQPDSLFGSAVRPVAVGASANPVSLSAQVGAVLPTGFKLGAVSLPVQAPQVQAVAAKPVEVGFQDKVLVKMDRLIELVGKPSVAQSNQYSLYGTDEVDVLRKAQQQAMGDLVDVFKGVRRNYG
jgi:hypothetical protein